MSQNLTSIALGGGLNLAAAPLFVKPGEALFMQNYVCDLSGGYRRIKGYERYDGRTSPSTFTDDAAREAQRALIQPVPGSGPVRGVAMLKGEVYAWRDNAGGTACLLYKAGSSGWTAVPLGQYLPFDSGNHVLPIAEGDIISNGSGATARVLRVVISAGSFAGAPSASGRLVVDSMVGSWASGNNIQVGGVNKARATGAVANQVLLPGGSYRCQVHNFYGSADKLRLYGVDGKNPAFEFDGTLFTQLKTAMPNDTPGVLCVHQNYLFLAFPGGSLQNSGVGEPGSFSPRLGASEIGTGDTITNLVSTRDVLATYCAGSIHLLYGAMPSQWQLKSFSRQGGAKARTAVDVGGEVLAYDDPGLSFLQAVQAYGDFAASNASEKVAPLIKAVDARFALMARRSGCYYLFLGDRSAIVPTLLGNRVLGYGRCLYAHNFVCGVVDKDAAGNERLFVGSDAGMVYELERGTSFDGTAMEFILRLPYAAPGGTAQRKRFHRLQLEMATVSPFSLLLQPDYDYGTQRVDTYTVDNPGAGGFWDVANWDEFTWDEGIVSKPTIYLSGIGNNAGFLIYGKSTTTDTFTIVAAHVFYTPRGQDRG
ncbi:hypothetical protein [Chitinimonas sp.]|uniref:hypothetical protein n=1 Tax=Chitinimonas sp. TaxID=1934313 RepID=UPI002F94E99A